MITELAELAIKPGQEPAFEAAVSKARPFFARAHGFLALHLHRTVERPSTYRLIIEWASLEDHTVTFRNSADFSEWRNLVGGYFAATPIVEHLESIHFD
jgi:heme-degrading monooxygenase HmoA